MTGYDEYQLKQDIRTEFDKTNHLIKGIGTWLVIVIVASHILIYIRL